MMIYGWIGCLISLLCIKTAVFDVWSSSGLWQSWTFPLDEEVEFKGRDPYRLISDGHVDISSRTKDRLNNPKEKQPQSLIEWPTAIQHLILSFLDSRDWGALFATSKHFYGMQKTHIPDVNLNAMGECGSSDVIECVQRMHKIKRLGLAIGRISPQHNLRRLSPAMLCQDIKNLKNVHGQSIVEQIYPSLSFFVSDVENFEDIIHNHLDGFDRIGHLTLEINFLHKSFLHFFHRLASVMARMQDVEILEINMFSGYMSDSEILDIIKLRNIQNPFGQKIIRTFCLGSLSNPKWSSIADLMDQDILISALYKMSMEWDDSVQYVMHKLLRCHRLTYISFDQSDMFFVYTSSSFMPPDLLRALGLLLRRNHHLMGLSLIHTPLMGNNCYNYKSFNYMIKSLLWNRGLTMLRLDSVGLYDHQMEFLKNILARCPVNLEVRLEGDHHLTTEGWEIWNHFESDRVSAVDRAAGIAPSDVQRTEIHALQGSGQSCCNIL